VRRVTRLTPQLAIAAWGQFQRRLELENVLMPMAVELELSLEQVAAVALVSARSGLDDQQCAAFVREFCGATSTGRFHRLVSEVDTLMGTPVGLAVEAHTALHAQALGVVSSPSS
jgi:hypothetical protein